MTHFEYHVGWLGSGITVDVNQGFITDLGSVPKPLWGVISPVEENCAQAFICHDRLCRGQLLTYHQDSGAKDYIKVSRKRCDEILEEALEVLNVTPWKIKAVMIAVNYHRIKNNIQ